MSGIDQLDRSPSSRSARRHDGGTQLVDGLQRAGLVKRSPHPTDRPDLDR